MIRVLVVFGTRPEAIKLAPVIRLLQSDPRFACQVCTTGQHQLLVSQVLDVFNITTDYDLGLMRPDQTPASVMAGVLSRLPAILTTSAPDVVVVQGDTTTTLAASLSAFLAGIPVAHVEAGLRSGDYAAPFPEEMNRVLTSRLATLHFAPTTRAREALVREKVRGWVLVTGNTVVDALLSVAPPPTLADPRYVLVTLHRRESFGDPMREVGHALHQLVARFPDVKFILPVHPNPKVREVVEEWVGVDLIQPPTYREFVRLLAGCALVLTDSGGIQEEAPSLGKPVLVLRDVTERPEGVEAGTAMLVGTDRATIVSAVSDLLTDPQAYARMAKAVNPYGDGHAAERIVDALWARL